MSTTTAPAPQLTLLYDGACPLCLREVRFLRQRDARLHGAAPWLAFVDVDAADYNPAEHGGISYREAMGRIHALDGDGRVLTDVAVFRAAYRLIGLGWLYAPSGWPGLRQLSDGLYGLCGAIATGACQQAGALTHLRFHSGEELMLLLPAEGGGFAGGAAEHQAV